MTPAGDKRPDSYWSTPAGRYWIVACILVVGFAAVRWIGGSDRGALDIYTTAVHRMMAGEQIFRTNEQAFTYPAFFALPFIPFALMPPDLGAFAWRIASGLVLAWTLLALGRGMRPIVPDRAWRWGAPWVIIAIILSARFISSPMEYASHDGLIFALLVGAMLGAIRGRTVLAGALLGLATACKATPLLFLPVLLLRGQWKASAAFVVACAAATFLPDLVFPSDTGRPWILEWYRVFVSKVEVTEAADVSGAWESWNHLNQGLTGTLHRLTAPVTYERHELWLPGLPLLPLEPGARKLLALAANGLVFSVTVLACGLVPWVRRRQELSLDQRVWREYAIYGAVTSAMLLLAPMSSKQHFCTLAIALAVASLALFHGPRPLRPVMAVGLAIVFLVGTLFVKDLVGRPLGNLALAWGSLTWCATACWVMSLTLLLYRPGPARAASTEG